MNLYNTDEYLFPKILEKDEINDNDKKSIEDELGLILQKQVGGIIAYEKNLENTLSGIDEEIKRLETNKYVLKNKLDQFKEYVQDSMKNANLKKVQTDLGIITLAKSPVSVEIINENEIPDKYKKEVVTTKIDKKKILEDFKENGEMVAGVKYNTENTNLRIK